MLRLPAGVRVRQFRAPELIRWPALHIARDGLHAVVVSSRNTLYERSRGGAS